MTLTIAYAAPIIGGALIALAVIPKFWKNKLFPDNILRIACVFVGCLLLGVMMASLLPFEQGLISFRLLALLTGLGLFAFSFGFGCLIWFIEKRRWQSKRGGERW